MNLAQMMATIVSSQRKDWNHISCWGSNSGPSYRNQFSFYEIYNGQPNVLNVTSHSETAAYIPDPSITLAFGLTWMDDFKEPWTENFPDPKTTAHFADVFYNGALVFREPYLSVDGIDLPWPPPNGSLVIPRGQAQFVELIDAFGTAKFQTGFRRAGMSLSEETWPVLAP